MSSGPPPKPEWLRVLEGNPGKQRKTEGPSFEAGMPERPAWLQKDGRKLWDRLVPELHEKGLLAKVNSTALESLCVLYNRAVQAERVLNREGCTFTTAKGYVGQRPEVTIANTAWKQLRHLLQEFGLTPASAGRVVAPKLNKPSLRDRLADGA